MIKCSGVVPLSTGGHATIIIFDNGRPCRRGFTGPDSLRQATGNLAQVMAVLNETLPRIRAAARDMTIYIRKD